jgi:hypothetical protein
MAQRPGSSDQADFPHFGSDIHDHDQETTSEGVGLSQYPYSTANQVQPGPTTRQDLDLYPAGTLGSIDHTTRTASLSQSVLASVKPGHVAPSHRRFTLPPSLRRKGRLPRGLIRGEKQDGGDSGQVTAEISDVPSVAAAAPRGRQYGWMWSAGRVGVWPA